MTENDKWKGTIEERLANLENGKFVTKDTFEPVRVIAYGIAATFFVAGVYSLLQWLSS